MRDYSTEDRESRLASSQLQRNAEIARGIEGRVLTFQKVYCDLATAQNANNAMKISVPFRALFVRTATDSTAVVYFSPNENSIGNIAEAMPLYKNDSFNFGIMIAGGYLWWPAQTGKIMEIYLSTEGEMKPGSQVSQIAGGLSVSDGSSLASNLLTGGLATIALPAAAATKILDTDTDRKSAELYFDTDVWVGDASVSPNARGLLVLAGGYTYKNTAQLYAYPDSGAGNVFGNVHK